MNRNVFGGNQFMNNQGAGASSAAIASLFE